MQVQNEAIWVLINVAFGQAEQAKSILEAGGVPKLIRLLKSTDAKLATQSAWALANLCGDGAAFRNFILAENVVVVLSELLVSKAVEIELEFLRTIVWLSLNISRHNSVQFALVEPLFQPLLNLLTFKDRRLLVDTCWFFTNYVNWNGRLPQQYLLVVLANFSPLLDQDNLYVAEAALRFMNAIVLQRSYSQNDQIVASGILPKIIQLITNAKPMISQLATMVCRWFVLTKENPIQALIEHNFMDSLIHLFDGENFFWKAKREGIRLVANILSRGSLAQKTEILINRLLLKSCFNLLKSTRVDIVKATLKMLSDQFNQDFHALPLDALEFSVLMDECGLKASLESNLDHMDDEVHELTFYLMTLIYPNSVSC